MSTEEWRERALAAEGELARLRASATPFIETAVDRVRRETERRATAPTEILPALPACSVGCPCSGCADARPDPDPDAWHQHQVLTLDPIHE